MKKSISIALCLLIGFFIVACNNIDYPYEQEYTPGKGNIQVFVA